MMAAATVFPPLHSRSASDCTKKHRSLPIHPLPASHPDLAARLPLPPVGLAAANHGEIIAEKTTTLASSAEGMAYFFDCKRTSRSATLPDKFKQA
jgi:hypothetical protein